MVLLVEFTKSEFNGKNIESLRQRGERNYHKI